ncbi:MAG: hypothetical protein ACT4OV_07290 [Microthrixaceae bacterium]
MRATVVTSRRDAISGLLAVLAWSLVVALGVWWGRSAIAGRSLGVDAAPLVGRWIWHAGPALLAPVLVASAVVIGGPSLAARARWSVVVIAAAASTCAWTLSLAASDGWSRVTTPLTTRHEYEPYAARVDGVGELLRRFVEQLPGAPIHVQGHPPGAPVVAWALDAIGLGGAGWFAALVILGWGGAAASVLLAARAVAGEGAARRAAPAVVLLPAAVWAGTSADALFAGVLAAGAALACSPRVRTSAAGGVLLGLGMLLSYGGALVLAVPGVVHLRGRRWAPAFAVAVGAAGLLALVALTSGFSWLEGLGATRRAYDAGIASRRPGGYFTIVGNPAALALAMGPATAVGLACAMRRWRDPTAVLPLAGLLVVLLADLSMLSKGEVERIWLPFVPWLALAAPGHRRGWLALQAALAVTLQAWLRSPW